MTFVDFFSSGILLASLRYIVYLSRQAFQLNIKGKSDYLKIKPDMYGGDFDPDQDYPIDFSYSTLHQDYSYRFGIILGSLPSGEYIFGHYLEIILYLAGLPGNFTKSILLVVLVHFFVH